MALVENGRDIFETMFDHKVVVCYIGPFDGQILSLLASNIEDSLWDDPKRGKKFFKILGIYIVVYAILNLLVMLFFVISGQEETMNSIRSTLTNCNLLLALLITWGITKYKMKFG